MNDFSIVVVLPSEGHALAVAAASRRFETPPQVLCECELDTNPLPAGTRVLMIDLLVALINKSPVPALFACADRLLGYGCEVIGYNGSRPREGWEALFSQILSDDFATTSCRGLQGYLNVVQGLRCCPRPLDELGRQLCEEATMIDYHNKRGECAPLHYDCLPQFGNEPKSFHRYIDCVCSQCEQLTH